jgi:hypothetical protein
LPAPDPFCVIPAKAGTHADGRTFAARFHDDKTVPILRRNKQVGLQPDSPFFRPEQKRGTRRRAAPDRPFGRALLHCRQQNCGGGR